MRDKLCKILLVICFTITCVSSFGKPQPDSSPITSMQQDTLAEQFPYYDDNEDCLTCHGVARYEFHNIETGKRIRRLMPIDHILSRETFYKSVHREFSCTDCHSTEFEKFPHPAELIFEEHLECVNCHGYDEDYIQYNFEEIDKEYKQSVHYGQEGDGFSCWKCHDPHGYIPTVRESDEISEIVSFANDMCLSCHTNFDRYQLLTDHEELDIIRTHDWLPNQALHFNKVRCIECHTKINDSILVAHHLLPKEDAVERCTECHSKNSRLMATLYKFQSKEQRKSGFFNGIILNESYVIGANRNEYLNILSFLLLTGTLGVILIHLIFRLILIKKLKNGK